MNSISGDAVMEVDMRSEDAKSLATTVVPLPQMLEAYEQVASRTTITALMTG